MIRIQWSVTTTERDDVFGGDTAVMDFSEIIIDATITESPSVSAYTTAHPIAYGADITDHVHPNLRTITLECIVSNQPTNDELLLGGAITAVKFQLPAMRTIDGGATPKKDGGSSLIPNPVSGASVLAFSGATDRVAAIITQLEQLIISGTRVDIYGLRLGDLNDRILTEMSPVFGCNDGVEFVLIAQELRVARTTRIAAPSPRVERARGAQANGRRSGTDATASTAAGQQAAVADSTARGLIEQITGLSLPGAR